MEISVRTLGLVSLPDSAYSVDVAVVILLLAEKRMGKFLEKRRVKNPLALIWISG